MIDRRTPSDPAPAGTGVSGARGFPGAGAGTSAPEDSETQFRHAFRGAPIGMALFDENGRIQLANPALGSMLACAPEDVVGRHFLELTHPDDRTTT
ncbi:MAG: PAS domain-containing protein, partial [Planctomycetota bacterium]